MAPTHSKYVSEYQVKIDSDLWPFLLPQLLPIFASAWRMPACPGRPSVVWETAGACWTWKLSNRSGYKHNFPSFRMWDASLKYGTLFLLLLQKRRWRSDAGDVPSTQNQGFYLNKTNRTVFAQTCSLTENGSGWRSWRIVFPAKETQRASWEVGVARR